MTEKVSVTDRMAAPVVGAVRTGYRHRLGLSLTALATTLVLGIAYLVFGVFELNPADRKIQVQVHFDQSGGILPDRDVTLRGVPVGRVTAVDLTDDGVVAVASIDSQTKIPQGAEVRVAGLSLAGEQYLDFRPSTDDGPYLTDGAVISTADTSTPVPLSDLMHNLDGMLAQIDPAEVQVIVEELGVSPEAPEKLSDIIDGGTFLISTLDSVLLQTVSVLNTSKVVLNTLAEGSPGMQTTSANLSTLLQGVESMDAGFRTFVDTAPATLGAIDSIIADNSPTMVQLLGNLATVSQMAYVRFRLCRSSSSRRSGTARHSKLSEPRSGTAAYGRTSTCIRDTPAITTFPAGHRRFPIFPSPISTPTATTRTRRFSSAVPGMLLARLARKVRPCCRREPTRLVPPTRLRSDRCRFP